jgi:hypothetical protein
MGDMFVEAFAFNQDINGWDVSSVIIMSGMFNAASSFNQDLNSWNVSLVGTFAAMFSGSRGVDDYQMAFNGNITSWVTTSAIDMNFMFSGELGLESPFNQNISGWDTSNVANMDFMLVNCTSFDQDLSSWDITSLTTANMLGGVTLSTVNYDALLIGWEAQTENPDVNFDAGNSEYTSGGAAETARSALVSNGWVITDGGPA